jgi:hypothetical protein
MVLNRNVCGRQMLFAQPVLQAWQFRRQGPAEFSALYRNFRCELVADQRSSNVDVAKLTRAQSHPQFGLLDARNQSCRVDGGIG